MAETVTGMAGFATIRSGWSWFSRHPGFVAALVILAALAIRFAYIGGKHTYNRDELVAYMAATAKQGRFVEGNAQFPSGRWVPNAIWQEFFRVDDPFAFQRISTGLARDDVHPPLYFWLLHAAVLAGGVAPTTGPVLNLVLFLAASFLVYRLAGLTFHRPRDALFAVFLWAFCYAGLKITLIARPYELLGLLGVASTLCLFIMLRRGITWTAVATYTALLGLGFLAHYYFLFHALGLSVVAFIHFTRRRTMMPLVVLGLATVAAIAILLVVFPDIRGQMAASTRNVPPLTADYALEKILDILASPNGMIPLGNVLFLVIPVLLFLLARELWPELARGPASRQSEVTTPIPFGAYTAVVLTTEWGAISVAYFLGTVPDHAIGERHLAAAWPLLAIVLVWLFARKFRWEGRWLQIVVGLAIAVIVVRAFTVSNKGVQVHAAVQRYDVVLADFVDRKYFPNIFLNIPAQTWIFAARPGQLLATPEPWLEELRGHDRGLYVSWGRRGSKMQRRKILEILRREFRVTRIATERFDYFDITSKGEK
ncbi:MAG: glycosyltransferase family 39 protein [SAR324 cluster bacterium]|nr:glycosyltransferase family 39 protein [SAR324 cluster bacterium]